MNTLEKIVKLSEVLGTINGSSFVSMDTVTTPKLSGGKRNPMQGRIKKRNVGASIMVFQNKNVNAYREMVRRRLKKEGKNPETFELKPRPWGHRIPNTPLVEHNGELYLEVIFLKSGKTEYTLDGEPIDATEIEGLVVSNKPDQGGLQDTVIVRTFKLNSIERLKIGKKEYKPNEL